MFSPFTIITIICIYFGLLFLLALKVEKDQKIFDYVAKNPFIYSLSLAIYCTAWTYYGSVGLAAGSGMLFLTIYLGPTLSILLGWMILRRMVRIKDKYRITSIADFISARYRKSSSLAALITIIALIGSLPYIALQLKAIVSTFNIITYNPGIRSQSFLPYMGLIIVGFMSVFTILLGIRRLDSTERHPGIVASIAALSVVKLLIFLLVGTFITFFMFNGTSDLFQKFSGSQFSSLMLGASRQNNYYLTWGTYIILAMSAILFLPRQFHLAVVENADENHISTAMWFFPAYMILLNIFVIPVAMAGIARGFPLREADFYLLLLPLRSGYPILTLLVFIGGLSAAAGMIFVTAITMATMVTNHLLLPLMGFTKKLRFLSRHLLKCRWIAVLLIILISYFFECSVGASYMLVNIGLISFAAVIQFAPAAIGGMFWEKAGKQGAILGIISGFLVWCYTLLMPSFVKSGWLSAGILDTGPWGLWFLKPEQLFGLRGLEPLTHGVFWSLLINTGMFIAGSILSSRDEVEKRTAHDFVCIMKDYPITESDSDRLSRKVSTVSLEKKQAKLKSILEQFLTESKAEDILKESIKVLGLESKTHVSIIELANLFNEVEKLLAGSIGTATAHSTLHREEFFSREESQELSAIYGEILAELKITPGDLRKKIDFYRERESILSKHSEELDSKIEELEKQILQRKEAEEALKESEHRYRLLVENVDIGISLIDKDHNIVMVNEAQSRILKRTAGTLIGNKCYNEYGRRDSVCPHCPGTHAIYTGKPEDIETMALHEDGTSFAARIKVFPIFGDSKEPTGFIEIVEDITERKNTERILKKSEMNLRTLNEELEFRVMKRTSQLNDANIELIKTVEELKQTQAQLVESEKMAALGNLVAGVAHEINTPVGIGLTAASHLVEETRRYEKLYQQGKLTRSDFNEFLLISVEISNLVLSNLDRAIRLIQSFKQVAVDQSISEKRRFNLKAYIDEILMSIHHQLKKEDYKIIVECSDDINLYSYPGALYQVFTNLILNSIIHGFHGKKHGAIKVVVSDRDERINIDYSDDGLGISEVHLKRIFEPFYTTRRNTGGSGLGLHIVYNLVTRTLKGRIECSSELNKGTSFKINFPFERGVKNEL